MMDPRYKATSECECECETHKAYVLRVVCRVSCVVVYYWHDFVPRITRASRVNRVNRVNSVALAWMCGCDLD